MSHYRWVEMGRFERPHNGMVHLNGFREKTKRGLTKFEVTFTLLEVSLTCTLNDSYIVVNLI